MSGTISTEQALIYTMVTMSGVEGRINLIFPSPSCQRRLASRFPSAYAAGPQPSLG